MCVFILNDVSAQLAQVHHPEISYVSVSVYMCAYFSG